MNAADAARTRWRCRRGLLELDIVLGRFFAAEYEALDDAARAALRRLLAFSDRELAALLLQGRPAPDDGIARIVERIRRTAERQA